MNEKASYDELTKRIKELELEAESLQKTIDKTSLKQLKFLRPSMNDIEGITFADIFVLEDIQLLQDDFAGATGVASIITQTDGTPITEPSNFCRLCSDVIRVTEKGSINCFKSDAMIGRLHPEGPIIQRCKSGGLWDAGAGISVGGKHIANWLIGQVRDETMAGEQMRTYAREIGVDETVFIDAFEEVPSMSLDKFQRIAKMLFTMAGQLSNSAYLNVQQSNFIAERLLLEEDLQTTKKQFQDMVENTSDWIWETDAEGSYTYASPRVKDILGHTPQSLIGKAPFDLMPISERDTKRPVFQKIIMDKASFHGLINRNLHIDGSERILETSGVPIIDRAGELTGYRGIDRDVTESRKLQHDIEQSEATLRSILKAAPIGIGMVVDRVFTFVNDRFCEMLGYSKNELIDMQSRKIYHSDEEFHQVGQEKYKQISQKGSGTVETQFKKKNGQLIDVLLSSTPLDTQDLLKGVTFTALDITDRKKSEQQIKESEERFRVAFQTSPDAININRLSDGVYIEINEGFTTLFGYTRDDVIGKNSLELNLWKDVDDRKRLVEGVTQNGSVKNLESQFIAKNGDLHVALISSSIIKIDGEPVILSVTRDITDRKNAENELKKYRNHLEKLVKRRTGDLEAKNKELETFTYSVSHDLKAPLRGIDGYSRLLMEEYSDKLDEEGLFFLNNVRQGATLMNTLIEDLLAYSRMERKELHHTSINLKSLIDNLVNQRTHDIEKCSINLRIDVPFQTIESDTETLRQVLTNYLDNAIKYSKKDTSGTVTIGGSEDSDYWTLWIKDDGIGFDPKYLDRIFDIFQRLHRVEEYPGTGIGLAIVRKAVERINGRVRANSSLGKGSTFYLDIPKR